MYFDPITDNSVVFPIIGTSDSFQNALISNRIQTSVIVIRFVPVFCNPPCACASFSRARHRRDRRIARWLRRFSLGRIWRVGVRWFFVWLLRRCRRWRIRRRHGRLGGRERDCDLDNVAQETVPLVGQAIAPGAYPDFIVRAGTEVQEGILVTGCGQAPAAPPAEVINVEDIAYRARYLIPGDGCAGNMAQTRFVQSFGFGDKDGFGLAVSAVQMAGIG